jgi:hypothetical protein
MLSTNDKLLQNEKENISAFVYATIIKILHINTHSNTIQNLVPTRRDKTSSRPSAHAYKYIQIVHPAWKIPTYTHLAYVVVLNAIIQDLIGFSIEDV